MFGWQVNAGTNYNENMIINEIKDLTKDSSDNKYWGNFARTGIFF